MLSIAFNLIVPILFSLTLIIIVDSKENRNIPSHERQALHDLYVSTNGDDWIYQDGDQGRWNFTDPDVNPCSSSDLWQGLNCTVISSDSSSYYYHISEIILSEYDLRGTIPSNMMNLMQLNSLDLGSNRLSGSIPAWIGNLTSLEGLYFNYNYFNGTIPNSLSNLTLLSNLGLEFNYLTGSIPAGIRELKLLTEFNFYSNHLQGTIPASICDLTSIINILLGQNYFSGTIPSCLSNLQLIEFLSLDSNMLSGTIPSSLGSLMFMKNLSLNDNMLTGSIPNIFDGFNQLSVLYVHDNLFTGLMPFSLADVSSLTELFVHDNSLSGDLMNVFNGSHQSKLTTVQLSSNQFTGELPGQLFLSKSLQSMSAVSNCFHGTIPTSICLNKQLDTLVLDGLVCALSCRTKILPGISTSYLSSKLISISGGIPDCLWSMPKLRVLHLSGNRLSGSLPSSDVIISSSLKDLSLSYNLLTGSIPSNIQTKSWNKLDLSHNRLSGTLHSNFSIISSNTSLFLTNNRLSGPIPRKFHDMRNIDVLEGSLYDCNYDRSNLPTYDKDMTIYECGSNVFNVSYYIWLGTIAIICMAMLVLSKYWKDFTQLILLIRQWIDAILIMTTDDNSEIDEVLKKKLFLMGYLQRYIFTYVFIRKVTLYSTMFIIAVLLPTYTVLSAFYRTHTYAYAWTVASMYLSGKTSFRVVMFGLVLFVVIQIVVAIRLFTMKSCEISFKDTIIDNQNEHSSKVKKIWPAFILYGSVNLIVVGGVNIGYVWVELYESRKVSLLCQILLSIFKLTWNNIVSPAIVRKMVRILSIKGIAQQSTLFFIQFVISIFNNIIIPCVMVMIISPNCFYHVFQQETDVISLFPYTVCTSLEDTSVEGTSCVKFSYVNSITSFSPPFTYSYQCSSDFITYYSPVFIFLCIISTFIFPCIRALWIRWKLPNAFQFSRVFYPFDESEVTVLMHIDQVYKELVY